MRYGRSSIWILMVSGVGLATGSALCAALRSVKQGSEDRRVGASVRLAADGGIAADGVLVSSSLSPQDVSRTGFPARSRPKMQKTCLRAWVATLDVLSVFTPGFAKSLLLSLSKERCLPRHERRHRLVSYVECRQTHLTTLASSALTGYLGLDR